MRRIPFALAAACALAGAALADDPWDRCDRPFGPLAPNPATATAAVMAQAKKETQAFIAQVDAYQECMLAVSRDESLKLTPGQKATIGRKIDASQREKEEIGAAYNAAVRAYNQRIGVATPDPAAGPGRRTN